MNEETTSSDGNSTSVGLLGEYLKQKRLDRNFTLEKLSQKTKISVNILKSLEANDFEHMPSAAYIKGFVTSYVKVLGLPLHEAITKMEYTHLTVLGKPFPALNHTKLMGPQPQVFQRTAAAETHSEEQSPEEIIHSSDSMISNTKSVLPFAILLGVILLFVGGYQLISTIVENEVNGQKQPDFGPKIEPSSALLKQPEPRPAKAPEAGTAQVDNNTQTAETPEKKEEQKLPEFQRNFPAVDFKKVKGKLFSVKTDAPENEDTTILPETIKSQMNSSLQNVYIRAVDGSTWVSYKIDNNPITSAIVSQGSDLLLQGSEVRLFLGNVTVTKIFYNNYLIETPTKTGVKSLIFPEESNSKYLLPLFPKAKDDILYSAEDYQKRMKLEEEELAKRQNQ